ncbi:MAG: EpsI family protein [Burkholderiales bacterium]|nr:EpsI family protein [Burkholderiales bacterium]
MILASASVQYMKPTKKLASPIPAWRLEKIVPTQFGDWKMAPTFIGIVNPVISAEENKLYGQILTRNYQNSHGTLIMLTIAYGGSQSKELQVHHPETCYAANGFQMQKVHQDTLVTTFGSLPVKRLFAVREDRKEPITYWVRVGDEAVVGMEVKLAQLRYGLTGEVPDGMLVRVSSISPDAQGAYPVHDDFIRKMLSAMSKEDRAHLVGHFEGQSS